MSERIASWMADAFLAETGFDCRNHDVALQRICEEAERVEALLHFMDEVHAYVPFLAVGDDGRPLDLRLNIKRHQVAEQSA